MNEAEIKLLQKKYAERIGEKIYIQRERAGYTQEEIGRFIAKNRTTVSRYEKGTLPMPVSDIPIFADLFNISTSYFFEFDEIIQQECKLVQESIRKSYELYNQMETQKPDEQPDVMGYMPPIPHSMGVGKLSESAIRRLADMGAIHFLYGKGRITYDEMMEYIVKIQKFDYSFTESCLENFDLEKRI